MLILTGISLACKDNDIRIESTAVYIARPRWFICSCRIRCENLELRSKKSAKGVSKMSLFSPLEHNLDERARGTPRGVLLQTVSSIEIYIKLLFISRLCSHFLFRRADRIFSRQVQRIPTIITQMRISTMRSLLLQKGTRNQLLISQKLSPK